MDVNIETGKTQMTDLIMIWRLCLVMHENVVGAAVYSCRTSYGVFG